MSSSPDGPAAVPVQRGAGGSSEETVLNLLLDGMREVKDQVVRLETHLGARLDGLDQRYIPRAEYEARHSDVRNLITRNDAKIEAEGARADARLSQLEEKLTGARRFGLTTSIALGVAVIALLTLILNNIH